MKSTLKLFFKKFENLSFGRISGETVQANQKDLKQLFFQAPTIWKYFRVCHFIF
jgi:hypothetical protein